MIDKELNIETPSVDLEECRAKENIIQGDKIKDEPHHEMEQARDNDVVIEVHNRKKYDENVILNVEDINNAALLYKDDSGHVGIKIVLRNRDDIKDVGMQKEVNDFQRMNVLNEVVPEELEMRDNLEHPKELNNLTLREVKSVLIS